VENPGKLFHATPTQNVERIMREGLVPCVTFMQADLDVELTNLSTKDESDLVVFFRHINGVGDEETGELLDTVTLLEVDVRDIPLVWPGQDGDHHYEVRQLITPRSHPGRVHVHAGTGRGVDQGAGDGRFQLNVI
jgi:hypothetical protein